MLHFRYVLARLRVILLAVCCTILVTLQPYSARFIRYVYQTVPNKIVRLVN